MTTIVAFTTPQVVRLTGVTARQLTYWEATGVFRAWFVDDRSGQPYRRVYNFTDVVSLRTLGVLRNQLKLPLHELRKIGEFLSRFSEFPWTQKFWVVDREVFFADPQDATTVRNRSGQTVFIVELESIRKEVEASTSLWNLRNPADVGKIDRHRHVQHNQWTIKGTRIPTANIWDFHEAGYDVRGILRQYPTLTERDIVAAIEHEGRLQAQRTAS